MAAATTTSPVSAASSALTPLPSDGRKSVGEGSSVQPGVASSTAKRVSQSVTYPDYPDAKTLLISSQRPRSFLERSARELLAGGTEVIVLSALGEAIPLCVQLQSALEEKKAAKGVKIETTYNCYEERPRHSGGTMHTAGLRIYMKKHSEFKGSRISPGYVSFCDRSAEGFTPCYDTNPKEKCASVNTGNPDLFVGGLGLNLAFSEVLMAAEHDVVKYTEVHKALLKKALAENENKKNEDVRSVQLEDVELIHSDLKTAMCRPCVELQKYDSLGATGAVFLSVFQKFPHGKENNMAMVYVVGPKGESFKTKEEFLSAVEITSANLMTGLCDYNGLARREHSSKKEYVRIKVCRIPLISGGLFLHSNATKKEVAAAIVAGLEKGYRHGPAPRLNFAYDEDLFRQVWCEITGLTPKDDASEQTE